MSRTLSKEAREEREQLILEKAVELYDSLSFSEITMSTLAKHCGMAKGTLFNYYPTKETLFAKILYKEYSEWGAHELEEIEKHPEFTRESYKEFVMEQTRYLLENRVRMIRLVSMKRSIISKNIAPEILSEEIEGLDKTVHKLSKLTEQKLDFLTEERIYNLYMARHVIMIGAYALATSPHNIEKLDEIHKTDLAVIETKKTVLKMMEELCIFYTMYQI